MVFISPVNMSSVAIVREELQDCVSQAVRTAEQRAPDSFAALPGLVEQLKQIDGILRVLECGAAEQLSTALLGLAQACAAKPDLRGDADALGLLVRGLVGLRDYLEYSFKRRQDCPLALNGLLNELRSGIGLQPLSEAQQIDYLPADQPRGTAEVADRTPLLAGDIPRIKRLQHMYQVGLLGVLTGANSVINLRLMACALARLQQEFDKLAERDWWMLVSALFVCLVRGELRLTPIRKRLLAVVDGQLRRRLRDGGGAPISLQGDQRCELLCLLQLAGSQAAEVSAVLQPYRLAEPDGDDRQLARVERELFGEGEALLSAQAQELTEELLQVKELLNEKWESLDQQALAQLTAHIQRVGDILNSAGFSRLKGLLADRVLQLEQARVQRTGSESEAFSLLAEALLIVESTLTDPDNFSDDALQDQVPAASLLERRAREEAIGVVLNESKAAIHLAKRGITAYLDSGFDADHIANVGTSLCMVQGAFRIMSYDRAADLLGRCIAFVDSRHQDHGQQDMPRQAIETLADALISIEYYIDDLAVSACQNEELLVVAEDSIADLGWAA